MASSIDVPKTIDFLELYKEITPRPDSIMSWNRLEGIVPGLRITSFKVTEPMGTVVESIHFLIVTDNTPGEQKGYRYVLHINE